MGTCKANSQRKIHETQQDIVHEKNMQDEDKIKLTNGWRLIRFLDRGPDISERHGDGDSTGVSFV